MQILPIPVHYEVQEEFIEVSIGDAAVICVSAEEESVAHIPSYLRAELARCCLSPPAHDQLVKLEISLCINQAKFSKLESCSNPREAYELVVRKAARSTHGVVDLSAATPQGLFWGVQSLLQLLGWPDGPTAGSKLRLPCVKVLDYPRFSWRGALLDTGRHWFSVTFVKKFIDLLAIHKLNVFHWHLTEDQGWRIEIRSHPRLTQYGAYRGQGKMRYGGFYSQDDIREIVSYATDRFVEVVPEIEMPGHCCAALACYPELSCTGNISEVPTQWGVQSDVYCAGKESTFDFLQAVLEEVLELFPSRYIHIGGDECPKTRWCECEACQRRVLKENLSGTAQLQTYFINRIATFLRERGRTIIGWDEVLEGGTPEDGVMAEGDEALASDAIVMSWRGTLGGIAAAKHKHRVIMTPNTRCYLDYRQSASLQEPGTWYAVLPLEWVYMFDPCCKMGQLDMRVVDEGGSKGQNVKGTEDVVAQQDAQEQGHHSRRSASSMSDLDNGGLHSTVQSSAATTLTTMGDGDSAPTQSGMSAVIGDSTEDESGVPTVAMSEAQAEAMMAHLALGLDIHDEKYILGGQGNLWTEFIADENTAEYMLIPRLCALSECLWSPTCARNWRGFLERVSKLLLKLGSAGYNYRPLVACSTDHRGSVMQ